MGSCKSKADVVAPKPKSLQYRRHTTIKRVSVDHSGRYQFKPQKLTLQLPLLARSFQISLRSHTYLVSECSLPSNFQTQFSRSSYKSCCFSKTDQNSLLVGLYLSHGPAGNQYMELVQSLYTLLPQQNKKDPVQLITHLTSECHSHMRNQRNFQSPPPIYTLLELRQNSLNFATCGPSKVFVATNGETPYQSSVETSLWGKELEKIKNQREIPSSGLVPIQISAIEIQDSKSDKVSSRMSIKHKRTYPGFLSGTTSMNSSSETNLYTLKSYFVNSKDQFLVVADIGIWSVMNSKEVVDFVQSYREFCKKDLQQYGGECASPVNTCVAHLLCEEARMRWITLHELRDVELMDIGCVVVEFLNHKVK